LFSLSLLTDNSSVIAATATATTTSSKPPIAPAAPPSAVKASDKRFPKACIKKVQFSSESLRSDVDELCDQLKDSALSNLSNDNIRIACHQNNNNSSINKNQNNNSIDISISISKMSETNESNDTAAQSAEGERPSFLVRFIIFPISWHHHSATVSLPQVGDEIDERAAEAGEACDEFPQKMQNDVRQNGDISERRKRLR